jgi:hypothetical protein
MDPFVAALRGLFGAVSWAMLVAGLVVLGMGTVMPWTEPDFRDAPLVGVAFLSVLAVVAAGLGALLAVAARLADREGVGRGVGLVAAVVLLPVSPLVGAFALFALLRPVPAESPPAGEEVAVDGHVQAAGALLLAGSLPLLALGVLAIPGGFLVGATEPEFRGHPLGPAFTGAAIAFVEGALLLGLGVMPAVAGLRLLRRRDPAAWGRAVGLAGLLSVAGCLGPAGWYVLWALGRGPVRRGFGVG